MATQTESGKAFEYALLVEFERRLSNNTNNIRIKYNKPYKTAKSCFEIFSEDEKNIYTIIASAAVNFLINLEPRLSHGISNEDVLELEIVSDKQGQSGDVRDVLAIRLLQNWEIGVSAKNNHRAVKHSRLSQHIDFGKKWLGINCSENYFNEIKPIFDYLEEIRNNDKSIKWTSIPDKIESIYKPILVAFIKELKHLATNHSQQVSRKLVEYLIGNKDFYKVIKSKNKVEIQAFNIHGSLNQSLADIQPNASISRVKLPTKLIDISFQDDSSTTIIATFNEGWQISFRLHNAKSTVEPSLKFDINLISNPHTLFINHIIVNEN